MAPTSDVVGERAKGETLGIFWLVDEAVLKEKLWNMTLEEEAMSMSACSRPGGSEEHAVSE